MEKNGVLLIVSGPSGSGKGTVVQELVKEENYALSISATTRDPRPNEKDGEHYFFRTKTEFEYMKEAGQLLEWACFCDNYYGTPKSYVEKKLADGKNVLLEIEVQGALKVRKIYPDCILIFMLPPSLEELQNRLQGRGTEDEATVQKRLNRALEEIKLADKYDYLVVNHTIEQAKADIQAIVHAEGMKSKNCEKILEAFKGER